MRRFVAETTAATVGWTADWSGRRGAIRLTLAICYSFRKAPDLAALDFVRLGCYFGSIVVGGSASQEEPLRVLIAETRICLVILSAAA